MKAVCWMGTSDVQTLTVPDPILHNPHDAILKVTRTAICGSDLHLYDGFIPTMESGDILGHEFMGIVEEVGRDVSNLQKEDRVVVPFTIACGNCIFCKKKIWSACDNTNPSDSTSWATPHLTPAEREHCMFRLVLSLLCSFAFALQVLVIVGCGGSPSTTTAGSGGGGSGSGGGPVIGGSPSNSSPGCGGAESGYNNQNGSVSGIWLQSPAPGGNPSNVTVNATAYATAAITQWTVCLDGQSVYQANNPATSISQAITIPTGQHLLWASVTDSANDSDRSEIRLIQVGPPPTSSTVLPTPPANAKVLTEMQNDQSNWSICSACAAGTNVTNNYTMTFDQSQPSLSGSSLEMYAGGPSWSNVLFKDIIMGTTPNTHFLWDFWVYHDPAAEAHFWSSELDFYVVLSAKEFMIGSQCDFGDGYWATWDSDGARWVLNGIACPHWTPGWHHVQEYDELVNNATQYRYDTLVFDGVPYGLNQTWNVNSTTWQDQIGLQYQLDQDTSGTPLHEWVDKVTLTMW